MAQRVLTQLISDLSGDEIPNGKGETIEFAYRGSRYSIDLTTKEAAGFDKSVAMYIEHATKHGSARKSVAGGGSSANDAKQIREWAQSQGIEVSPRGRISKDIVEQYRAAR